MTQNRFIRQLDLVPPEKMAEQKILVIGAGAVGRNLGNVIAAMGAKNVRVIDFDTVELTNITTQGYSKEDVGKVKSEVLVESMKKVDYEGDADFQCDTEMWRPSKYKDYNPTVVFSCVDSMEARSSIFKFCEKNESVQLFIDSRMQGLTIKLLSHTRKNMKQYADTLFSDEEAFEGRCTQRSTLFSATTMASLAASQLSLHLRGIAPRKDFTLDLLDALME